ncbi:hypothetical protein BD780_000664 [Clostridium tetanomorphum]|uniref:DNRLRE domain-containing protein n=2 Tax=Clostridium tetanomorphum TaxID=1553 RepID=A0A923J0N5_CLOTT|nr:hypothetical protein CTM_13035 [Clostridium tetanomorphum DSM 665]MBC2396428.1 DNRLRE domain-containing protein [Clostridium tetanomorphum]MBP1863342.1 hypothetical protein [Clostridium tetanomorphum]NRS83439.1 hypothetical protein [Clostridium tetanomorphum]NRZ96639.1 hypothetical protein [Clostridium tetanomorphum]
MPEMIFYSDYDVTLDQANPGTNWAESDFLLSGLYLSSSTPPSLYRSLLHFDVSSIPSSAVIESCTLSLYVYSAVDPNIRDFFTPYLVNSSWTEATKWATQPGINYSIRGSSEAITSRGFVNFDITTLLKYWVGTGINNGLVINSTEIVEYGVKTFFSSNETTSLGLRPFIKVVYNDPSSVFIYERRFENMTDTVITSPSEQATAAINISNISEYTIFIRNIGDNPIKVSLDVSPDGSNFLPDTTDEPLAVGELGLITPKYFTNYIRLRYSSPDGISNLKYWILKQY